MDGIICIYKEKGYTSFDVVAIIRKLFKTKKVGHAGTLDPMAEGVLPIFMGNATKAVDFQPVTDKEYIAGFRFGITTDTQDITGKVTSANDAYVSRNKMALVERYIGEIEQIPPMFSAVQIDGVRLYDLAREGKEVERKPRKISIHSLKVESYNNNEGVFKVNCSKGTYVRTLIHDIGHDIGTGAVMTSLVRTRSGVFTLNDCHKIDDLKVKAEVEGFQFLSNYLLPMDRLFAEYPKAFLDEIQTHLFNNGVVLDAGRIRLEKVYNGIYTVLGSDLTLLALAKIEYDHSLKPIQRFGLST